MTDITRTQTKSATSIEESTLLKLAVGTSFDAAKAIAGLGMIKVGANHQLVSEWTLLQTEEDFDLLHHNDNPNWPEGAKQFSGYTLDMLAQAKEVQRVLGDYYTRDGKLGFDEVKALIEPLRNVPVKKRFMNRLNDQNPAEIVSFPFHTLLKSMEAHPEVWDSMLESRRAGREI